MSTNIPLARALIKGVLDRVDHIAEDERRDLEAALGFMTRTVSPARRSRSNQTMTRALGEEARRLYRHSSLTHQEIAMRLSVNPGRVSEAINGMWT